MVPLWRQKEIEAEAVNCTPAVDGQYKWKCQKCGSEWFEPANVQEYDRTKDYTNWPVWCAPCLKDHSYVRP